MVNYLEIALANIDRHLGDVVDSDTSPEEVFEEVYILAYDAMSDAGCIDPAFIANQIAEEISGIYS